MVALVIIYNHKFEKNIERLESIYNKSFSNIYHVMPFYTGNKENVITVYDHSYYFQGYAAQAYQSLKTKGDFDHFMFIADDMILHPDLNENNYKPFLALNENSSFITYINSVAKQGDMGYPIFFLHQALYFKLPQVGSGIEILNDLPSYTEAVARFKEKGFDEPYIKTEHVYFLPKREEYSKGPLGAYWYNKRKKEIKHILSNPKIKPEYPITCSYSDFFVISKKSMPQFAQYCGIFATCRLFVDYAIPTSMILSCDNIKTCADIPKRASIMTENGSDHAPLYDSQPDFETKFEFSLTKLLENFPDDILFVHPIKLSKWK